MSMRFFGSVLALFLVLSFVTTPLSAQTPASGTLRVTVVDATQAVVIGASVTVTPADRSDAPAIEAVKTVDAGVATIANLAPGRYKIQAEFPGFEPRVLPDVRVRSGENRVVAVLQLGKMEASVTVGQDKQQAAADPRGFSFGTTLTREQIEALSDDPVQLQQQLQDMAGPGAVIRVDGFEGSPLPAKAQIRSIRISRDQFAAEYHNAGGVSIEIITQPGLGPIRYNTQFGMRGSGLSGRSPFVPVRGPEGSTTYGIGLGGGLIKEKSSFNLNVFGQNTYETPNLNAILPGGQRSEALPIKTPRDNIFVSGQMDYALTLDQTLRFGYNMNRFLNGNLGVGGFEQQEHAYTTENRVHNIRVQHYGPIGRRAFSRSRLQVIASDSDSTSALQAPAVIVNGAFTAGGAQLSGGEHSRRLNLGSDLDYVRGRNSIRAGISLDSAWNHSDASANYLGTYTFDSLDAYEAGRPSNYSRRIGDPNLTYRMFQAAFYVQDDFRPRKNLTFSPGIRYEVQRHVGDATNFGPRFGATWAPFAAGTTTLRASVGTFFDWLPNGTYEQSLRVDGFRQQELNIFNPSFPDPGGLGSVPPINRYMLEDDYRMPKTTRVSAGVDQVLLKTTRVAATYSYQRGERLARGLNLNSPVNGVRPDPTFRNIVDVVSDASSRQHQLQIDMTANPGAMLASNGPRIDWKRTTLFLSYSLTQLRNNSDGPFAIPATGALADEWGPAANDVRHRLNATLNNQIVKNFLVGVNVNRQSADAYTLLTGRDDNGDGVFNDRPSGVGRNTLRMDGQFTLNLNIGYAFTFGKVAAPAPPGIGVFGGGNAAVVRTVEQSTTRYRLQIFMFAQNVTNEANYVGYSGTMTSRLFGQPTTVRGMRKIDIGMGLSF